MNNISFQETRREDLEALLDIYNHYVKETTVTWDTETQTLDAFRDMVIFSDRRYKTFSILENGALCGFVLVNRFHGRGGWDQTAEITIYLKPESRGRGIGTPALRHIEAFAKSAGIHVVIASICADNTGSIRLFEKNGYEQCAHYREAGYKFGRYLDALDYQKIIG